MDKHQNPTPHAPRPAPREVFELRLATPVAELDPFGELKVGAQIRLLQLAAAQATAAAGFDGRWYDAAGVTWVVRYTEIERLAPARHDDQLVIRTWVSDFRRVRSWRHYELTRAEDGQPVARARTDWVFVDAIGNGPAVIPEEIQRAFMPQGVATEARPKKLRFEADRAALPLRRVEWPDLDALGHVNNAVYAGFIEQAVLNQLTAAGWAPSLDPSAPRLRLTRLELEYLTPALFGQQLSGRVDLARPSERLLRAAVEILTDDHASVRAVATYEWSEGELPRDLAEAVGR